MNALKIRQVVAKEFASTGQIRGLTTAELEEVAGGILPVMIIVGAAVAVALQECGEESSDNEDDGGDGND